ncbi:LacI family DNA-binding transcriptional regulator [Brenneria goodwinii]|uniref:LacI family DNA-binding transcriptional regulator n=1 Tax=Brenneria goodwinii TaxID=1109412 RepID=UPI0036E2E801
MVTINDVANKVGVSASTVSRVLSGGNNRISEATKRAVLKAIDELGYRPNVWAQSFSKSQTNTIGLVIPKSGSGSFFLIQLMERCQELAELSNKFLMITMAADDPLYTIQSLMDRRCDGILFYSSSRYFNQLSQNDQLSEFIEKSPKPIVIINGHLSNQQDVCFDIDQAAVARNGVEYLINKGHKDIAYISGQLNDFTARSRLEGYEQALRQADITPNTILIVEGGRKFHEGYEACLQLLNRNYKFTAIACFNDQIAIGALKALHEKNISVPDQVSILGLDDENILNFLNPTISSISVPKEIVINRAFNILLNKMHLPLLEVEDTGEILITERNSVINITPNN